LGRATLSGNANNDVIALDSILRGSTADGGTGNDTLQGGVGADTLAGGGGSDAIVSAGDGEIDTVDCGPGLHIVFADTDDDVSHCEIVQIGGPPVLPQVTAARADAQAFVAEMPSSI
jgi:Ca2+-binding RTX toxin-like protein